MHSEAHDGASSCLEQRDCSRDVGSCRKVAEFMKVIGVTGGVGSGKTELLHYIEKNYNCRILLSDEASHEVMRKGGRIYKPLVELLEQSPLGALDDASGAENDCAERGKAPLLQENGEINRREMAARIFANGKLRGEVNALIHPAVKEYILERIREEQEKAAKGAADAVDYFFLEAALLIECGYRSYVDEMWYIYCDLSVRRKRLRESRGYSDAKIDGILSSQLSEEEFRAGSDIVIDNSGSLENAYRQVREALRAGK